jgi:hypothetical protein
VIDAGFWWSCHTRCLRRWHSEQDVVARLSFDGCMLAGQQKGEVEVEEHYIWNVKMWEDSVVAFMTPNWCSTA